MYSPEVRHERKWRPFPALRKALEDKHIPDSYYGIASTSDDMFSQIDRILEIAILVHEHETVIKQVVSSVGSANMYEDLRNLETSLKGICSMFQQLAEDIRALSFNL